MSGVCECEGGWEGVGTPHTLPPHGTTAPTSGRSSRWRYSCPVQPLTPSRSAEHGYKDHSLAGPPLSRRARHSAHAALHHWGKPHMMEPSAFTVPCPAGPGTPPEVEGAPPPTSLQSPRTGQQQAPKAPSSAMWGFPQWCRASYALCRALCNRRRPAGLHSSPSCAVLTRAMCSRATQPAQDTIALSTPACCCWQQRLCAAEGTV